MNKRNTFDNILLGCELTYLVYSITKYSQTQNYILLISMILVFTALAMNIFGNERIKV